MVKCLLAQTNSSPKPVWRQWAKPLEQSGQFKESLLRCDLVRLNAQMSRTDTLLWHHAIGLLPWREGRMIELQENLQTAVDLLPGMLR